MSELVAAAGTPAAAAAAPAAAKKSKKTAGLNEVPRFGRVKSNLKVSYYLLLIKTNVPIIEFALVTDGNLRSTECRKE